MFICDVTKKPAKSGEKPTRIVVETRPRTYDLGFDEDGIPHESYGHEIVREIQVSKEGMRILNQIAEQEEETIPCE